MCLFESHRSSSRRRRRISRAVTVILQYRHESSRRPSDVSAADDENHDDHTVDHSTIPVWLSRKTVLNINNQQRLAEVCVVCVFLKR